MRSSRAQQSGSMTSLVMLMMSLFACFYTAGRLWQDAEMRYLLVGLSENNNVHQDEGSLSDDERWKLLDCKDQQKRLADAETELVAAKSQGYISKFGLPSNSTPSSGRLHAVVGIMTDFGGYSRRTSSRTSWMLSGSALKQLENDKSIVIRFVIGRSANKGDMSDKQIDREDSETKDFLILGDHVESEDNLPHKSKLYFSTAVEQWDADFYLKMDDNVALNIDRLGTMLAKHWDNPRVYLGCMKSGEVISDSTAQWYEPDWWKFGEQKSDYHRHAAGQVYALSTSLARYISINSAYLKEYKNEDVSVGAWMLGLETEHVDDRNLCCTGTNTESSGDNGVLGRAILDMIVQGNDFCNQGSSTHVTSKCILTISFWPNIRPLQLVTRRKEKFHSCYGSLPSRRPLTRETERPFVGTEQV